MIAQPNSQSTPIWRKSSASGGSGNCVEVARSGSFMLVRDSRNPSGAVLQFTSVQWLELLQRIQNGQATPSS
jgi:Domain of unknown function (DUF397)